MWGCFPHKLHKTPQVALPRMEFQVSRKSINDFPSLASWLAAEKCRGPKSTPPTNIIQRAEKAEQRRKRINCLAWNFNPTAVTQFLVESHSTIKQILSSARLTQYIFGFHSCFFRSLFFRFFFAFRLRTFSTAN